MRRRLCALLSAAALCLTLTIPAGAAGTTFIDVSPTKDAWCYTQVMKVSKAGLMDGLRGNYFGKNDPLTRVQIVITGTVLVISA